MGALGCALSLAAIAGCAASTSSSLPSTHAISGTVEGAASVDVAVVGSTSSTHVTTDASGAFHVEGLPNGTYLVTPTKAGHAMAPAQRAVSVNGASVTGQDFTAIPLFSISGTVSGAAAVDVTLVGTATSTAAAGIGPAGLFGHGVVVTTDGSGGYRLNGIPDGTYTIVPSRAGHAVTPVLRAVVVNGASAARVDFDTVALAPFDPLSADTLDGARWETPEFVRTISGGRAALSVRASGMQSNLVHGLTYTNALTVADGGARVTTLQADVAIPAASAARTGDATLSGGLRLYYQPAATRGLSSPEAFQDQLIASLELYEAGGGLRVRRRFAHCDDAACVTLGSAQLQYVDPVGFTTTSAGVNATAAAAYDTSYTLRIALDETAGVFTWTVQGGTFGATGVAGTVDVSAWAAAAGLNLASTTNGFLSAKLHARTSDASPAGGGSGALTATFGQVRVGLNGAAATLWDDFAGTVGSTATGFSPAAWAAGADGAVVRTSGALHLRSGVAGPGASASTTLSALPPATFRAWQADVALQGAVGDPAGAAVQVGGAFLSDGTAGPAGDATGDVVSRVVLRVGGASAWIGRCADPSCSTLSTLAEVPLPASPLVPLDARTVHTVFQQWDPATRAFAYRLDDARSPVIVPVAVGAPAPARAPSRQVRAHVAVPAGAPARTAAAVDVTVGNVRAAP